MIQQDHKPPSRTVAAVGFIVLCLGIGALGGIATASSVGTWYQTLAKPSFNPPDAVFGPVWTTLYVMIGLAGWRLWCVSGFSDTRAFVAYGVQLALNLAWSFLFFGLRMVGAAMAELILLWIAIAVTLILFWRRDRTAGLLLVPYLAWVSFAGVLNGAIWRLNP